MTALAKQERTVHSEELTALIRDHGDKAIRCCVDSWNELCPQHLLTNLTEVKHRKRWLFCGHDMTMLEEGGDYGEISKIAFEINEHLTSKALRRHKDSPVIILNCWIWWNFGKEQVHGWFNHITIDVIKDRVTQFPQIIPPTSHVHCCPLP